MSAKPLREIVLATASVRHLQHEDDHLGLRRFDLPAVETEEDVHGHECDALVAVEVAVVPRQAVAIGRRQSGDVALRFVGPFVSWTRESRLEDVFVPDPGLPAMLQELLVVNRVDDEPMPQVDPRLVFAELSLPCRIQPGR